MRKKIIVGVLSGFFLAATFSPVAFGAKDPSRSLLPDHLKIYYKDDTRLSRTSFKGGKAKVIPVDNEYKKSPGCYLACYAKHTPHSVYKIDGAYMMGHIRVPGRYANGMCLPKGYEEKNIKVAKKFTEKCERVFPEKCENKSCWVDCKTSNFWFN